MIKGLRKQSGFIITLESVLIFTILGIGIIVGVIAVRDALFKKALSIQQQNFYVFDSTPDDPGTTGPDNIAIGKVIGFDEHEAALVPFIDYDVSIDGETFNLRALIGVRDDRFTSRHPVFYTDAACTSDPCIAGPSDEVYNYGIDERPTTGSVGYLYKLQDINDADCCTYGIGYTDRPDDLSTTNINETYVGSLYRQHPTEMCSGSDNMLYVWDSQRVIDGNPCVNAATVLDVNGVPDPIDGDDLYRAVSVDANSDNVLDILVPPFWTNMVSKPPLTTALAPSKVGNDPAEDIGGISAPSGSED